MMTKVHNLEEIPSSIPPSEGNPRRFNVVSDQLMLVDLDKAVVARTFKGSLVFPVFGSDHSIDKPETLIEIFWTSGLSVVTVFSPDIKNSLLRFFPDEDAQAERFAKSGTKKNAKIEDDGSELPFNERKALPSCDQ